MKKSVVLAVAVVWSMLLPLSGIFCQESENEDNQTSVPENKWGLQFMIAKNFQLSSFQGTTLSVMRKLNEKKAMRAGISISGGSGENTFKNSSLNQDSLIIKNKVENQNFNLNLSFDYLFTNKLNDKISFYFGTGPNFGLMKYNAKQYADSLLTSTRENGWSIGLSGIAGIAWQVHKKIMIHAEYKSILTYRKNEGVQKSLYSKLKSESKSESVSFNSNPVLFGVTVYL